MRGHGWLTLRFVPFWKEVVEDRDAQPKFDGCNWNSSGVGNISERGAHRPGNPQALFSVLKIVQAPAAMELKHFSGVYFYRYRKSKTACNIFIIFQIYWFFFS